MGVSQSTLLAPRVLAVINEFRFGGSRARTKLIGGTLLALLLWAGVIWFFYKVLAFFQATEGLGDFLAKKLLDMVFLTLLGALTISNVITALSTFFLSHDLEVIVSRPVEVLELYVARFITTIVDSSWMVLIFVLPVFIAYQIVFGAPLYYYLVALLGLLPFLAISTGLGFFLVTVLVLLLPARRSKDILFLLSIFLIVILYLVFRFLRPERLVDPNAFIGVAHYLKALRTPTSPYLPSRWLTDALWPALTREGFAGWFHLGLLWSFGAALLFSGGSLAKLTFFNCFSRAQESGGKRPEGSSKMELLGPVSTFRGFLAKEFKFFFRDNTQWSQLLLIIALVVVYLYNYKVLPLDRAAMPTLYLQNLVGFLNLGLAAFVVASLGVRFVFPSVSQEGRAFWIVQSSPTRVRTLLAAKYLFYLPGLLFLGQVLIVATNHLLKVTDTTMWITIIAMAFLVGAITSLGVGMGAARPDFKAENQVKVATSFQGLIYMLISMGLIGLVVLLCAGPAYTLFVSEIRARPITAWQWVYIAGSFGAVAVVCTSAMVIPLRRGARALAKMEG